MRMAGPHVFYVVPLGPGSGLTTVTLGLVRALDRAGLRVGFHKPVQQPGAAASGVEPSSRFVAATSDIRPAAGVPWARAEALLSQGQDGQLLEDAVGAAHTTIAGSDLDVVIMEGLIPTAEHPELDTLNVGLTQAFDAEVLLVGALHGGTPEDLAERVGRTAQAFGGLGDERLLGLIVNKLNEPQHEVTAGNREQRDLPHGLLTQEELGRALEPVVGGRFALLGAVPWNEALAAPRTLDVARHLNAGVLVEGDIRGRRVNDVAVLARTVPNVLHRFRPGTLLFTPGDRADILLAVAMAASEGVPLAGLVLTGGIEPDARVMRLCERAFGLGLPVLTMEEDSYVSAARAASIDLEVPADDLERIERVMDAVAGHLDVPRLTERVKTDREPRLSPAAFMHSLVTRARAAGRRIVLPEGEEPRTVKAAVACSERGIARCVLIGRPAEVERVAANQGLELPSGLEVIEPAVHRRERYVPAMVDLRRHKGVTEPVAREQLEDSVVLGTMMLQQGEVDGLVSGAVHTTANTVRPALQLIGPKADAKLISSVFFMCLPDQVLVYGDCAINPDPNAEELADIAVQSAASAAYFGVAPRVAMLSYSTGESGAGSDVDKVREATRLARERRPDLPIDGPLQYDAASVSSVAASKAPGSPVAGRATVLIFPDLNTGNTTYKAVQRSADVVSVGPMLQGLARPVNDLSRGASVDDIVYTIALTAIQAQQVAEAGA
jgi:phosphate acetyltransferase